MDGLGDWRVGDVGNYGMMRMGEWVKVRVKVWMD